MANPYQSVGDYLQFIRDKYNVQICVKDFGGFIHINKDLSEALDPFLAHTNPFCLYMKSEPGRFHVCLSMIRKMHDKLLRTKKPFFGVCHAGLGEYVVPVYSGDLLLGTVNAGFFQTNEARTRWCIAHACRCSEGLETERALELYAANIATPTIPVDDLLVELQLVAGHLGQSYQALNNTHAAPNMARRYQNSSEDTIFSHAVEYVRISCTQHVSLPELARFCHCSESYLSHLFKRHAGVNVSTYVNKVRVEQAKGMLRYSLLPVADVACACGFNDPNYFSRVFARIMGIPPSEYRRRFLDIETRQPPPQAR